MKKGWTTTKLIATGAMGVLWAIISLPGLSLGLITRLFSGSFAGLMFPLTVLIVRQFGAGAIAAFVFSLLTTPLSTLGPIAILPRLLIDTSEGLFIDILYSVLRRNDRVAALVIGFASTAVWPFLIAIILIQLGLEIVEKSLKFILTTPLILAFLLGGLIEGYIAYLIYQRIKSSSVVRKIQG